MIVDLQRAVDLLVSHEKVDSERLAYIGGSYGGALGGLFAGVETRIKTYVLKVGDGGILEHLSEPDKLGYPVHLDRWVNILWPIEPLHYIGRAAPAELLFQNGIADSYVPASDSLRYQQAGSEPKTIIWYNEGHFLPSRHYYDHLTWQHERIGVNTILLKPFFSATGFIYDRLLLIWFGLSGLSLLYVIWDLGVKSRAGWNVRLTWSLVILFLGPVGLVPYRILRRRQKDPSVAAHALSASLWAVPVTMTGFAIVEHINFLTVFGWQIKIYQYYFVPQVVVGLALLLRGLRRRQVDESKPKRASSVLFYLFFSTRVTIYAFLIVAFLGREMLHFSYPIYHPIKWFIIMLASILIVILTYPLNRLLWKWGAPLLGVLPEPPLEERPAFQWYKAFGLALGAYLLLFVVHATYITNYTPIYVKFLDVIKMMLGMA